MTQGNYSLQRRFQFLVLAAVSVIWVAVAFMSWFNVNHEMNELLDSHLAQAASVLVAQQVDANEDDDRGKDDDKSEDAPSLHPYAPKVAFQVFHEGNLVLHSAGISKTPLISGNLNFKEGFHTVQIEGKSWRVFATHGVENDIQVYVAEEMSLRTSILWAVLKSTLLPTALGLPLLALILWGLVSRGMRPLRELRDQLVNRRADSIDALALQDAPSEMQPVTQALNGLFGRIASMMESERRFTADASHELRTPIAAIRAQTQVALSATDDAERSKALRNALLGSKRAQHIVEQLLTLSRLESIDAGSMGSVDLGKIARDVISTLAARTVAKNQNLSLEVSDQCFVHGNEVLLSVMLRNLIDNAHRYSPSGSEIRVSIQSDGEKVKLCVEDSGPGLKPEELARLGERFFRPVGTGEDGSGLGWSIVMRIAKAHQMEIQASKSEKLGGLSVLIQGTALEQ